jgi:polysaccharide biosynthesis/export protein
MKVRISLLALALCALLTPALAQQDGGGGQAAPAAPTTTAGFSGGSSLDSMGVKKYLLGPGDVLDLRVFNEPQFNGPLVVNDEGRIEIPFVDDPVPARCRTDREIKQDIVAALGKYIKRPQVSLRVTEMRSRPPAVVFGAVRSPSRVQMQRRARLLDVLAFTGGTTEAAGGDVQIFHTEELMCPEPEDEIVKPLATFEAADSTQVGYELYSLGDLRLGKAEANPVIRPGDIVIVQEALPVYITGAVASPTGLYLKQGLVLKQALAMVGGLRKEAKASEIIIWRRKEGSQEPEKLVVNFNDIRKEKIPDVALKPYDIVEVKDNSGSLGNTIKGILTGSLTGGATVFGQTLPTRILY